MKYKILIFSTIYLSLCLFLDDISALQNRGRGHNNIANCKPFNRRGVRQLRRDGSGPYRNGHGPRGSDVGPRANCPNK